VAHNPHPSDKDPASPSPDPLGVLRALRAVLAPLARLAVARGVAYRDVDELVKEVFVDAARAAHGDVPLNRAVSRVSVATGISRREVTRLVQPPANQPAKKSPANELFARWLSDPRFQAGGEPIRRLRRAGPHPSFQSLAESVSRDVKPRTHLEELCRLGLARVDDSDDCVELLRDTFVPSTDDAQMFEFLGENVGDHLSAAVANVMTRPPPYLEQALFADDMSTLSIGTVRPLIAKEWKDLVRSLAPVLQRLVDEDRAAGRPQDQRLRIGMYAFTAATASSAPQADPPSIPTPQKQRRSR